MPSELDLDIPGALPEANGRPQTVLEWLAEAREEHDRQKRLIDEAEVRERMVFGEQWRMRDAMPETMFPSAGFYDFGLIQENLLYPLVYTWAARVDQGRIDPRAFPFHPSAGNVEAAKALDTILDYEKQKCGESELIAEAAVMAQCHGDVLFYPQWSEADGPHRVQKAVPVADDAGAQVDEAGQPITTYEMDWEYGGCVEDVIAAPDYWTSGEDHYKQAQWVVVRRIISKSVARERLRGPRPKDGEPVAPPGDGEKRYPDADPQPEDFPTAMQQARRGVECFEMWMKPGTRTPVGCFALVVQGKVVKSIPYPAHPETGKLIYDGELPGDVWKIGFVRGSPRGKTHVADAIHQQRLVNSSLRAILGRAEVARSCWLAGPSDILDQMPNAKSSRVNNDTGTNLKESTGWFEGPDVPEGLMKVYQDAKAACFSSFGVSEATVTGGDPTETKSAVQLRESQAADGQKIRPARGALERARMKVAKDKGTLWQVHADDARYVRVLGPGGDVAGRWLRGADLEGADVALEIGSGIQSSHLAGQRDAEQSAEAGYLSPTDAIEQRQTGLPTTVGAADSMARIDAQAKNAAKGKVEQPLPDVDPHAAVDRLHTIIGSMAVSKQDPRGVVALAQAYAQMAALKAKSMAASQGAAAGPGRMPTSGTSKGAVATTDAKKQIPGEPQ